MEYPTGDEQVGKVETTALDEIVRKIVMNVAEASNHAPNELPPLAWEINLDSLEQFLDRSDEQNQTEILCFGQQLTIAGDGSMTMDGQNNGNELYNCRCNTCGETRQEVDHSTAQDFFADHLDLDHAPEIFRVDISDPSFEADQSKSNDATGPD